MKIHQRVRLYLLCLVLPASGVAMATDGGRTSLSGPEEAEVIANTGYQHTLFDSAEQKCQHCHNDLYDTWKTSMHAKSWKDPIFQSKYQDFLRLQASKIGAVGPTGTYQEATIQKTGRVCIKCHAPTAYYSDDYKISLTEVGDQNADPNAYADAKATMESNIAPAYNPANEATVVSMAKTGKVYTVSYHIGNNHNREGINCAFCHSIETVRMMNDVDGDLGQYTLKSPMKAGPIGPVVRNAGDTLMYSPFAHEPDMNAFFALIGPEKYNDTGDTPKQAGDFDVDKKADGRYTMKSTPTGCNDPDDADGDGDKECHYTGGPFYGPFGVTGTTNSRDDDATDRASLVKQDFVDAVYADHGDKFESKHHFAAYGKSLCLSCHQRSSLALNPESNGIPGVQPGDDQFLELCSTWTAMSDGIGDNYTDTEASPKCQNCHMEPLDGKTVLHQWDQPDTLFTLADNPELTEHFLPPSDGGTVGPVAEGYLNNHAFMGANTADFGTAKIRTGFESGIDVELDDGDLTVDTFLQNKTAHMFPGAHPMRRVATRVVVTDADGNKLAFKKAKGKSKFKDVTNQLAVLDGNTIKAGFDEVRVDYNKNRDIVIQGYTPDLVNKGEYVSSQKMDQTLYDWVSPDATVTGSAPVETAPGVWAIKGQTTTKKIVDIEGAVDHFTRIYGRETGKRAGDGTHVVRPGFDSNIATDNRLMPNEREQYAITYDVEDAVFPLSVKYKVYYLKKGASGKFPAGPDGFYETSSAYQDPAKRKKLAIFAVYDETITVDEGYDDHKRKHKEKGKHKDKHHKGHKDDHKDD